MALAAEGNAVVNVAAISAAQISVAQIAAQLDAVLGRDDGAQVVAIRSTSRGDWPASITRRGRTFQIRWCESSLALREELENLDGSNSAADGLVIVTPLQDTEVSDDVAARLARARVFQPKGWDIVRQLFGAQDMDARLGRHEWMPQVLIESSGMDGFSPVASGFLDLEAAWREILARCLHFDEPRPDATTLMRWACRPDSAVLVERLPQRAQTDLLDWLSTNAGVAGKHIVRCIQSGRAADAAPLGLVCDVVFAASGEGQVDLAQAAVRLERFVGDQHVTVADGREWAAQAKRLLGRTPVEEARPILDRADSLLRELRVADSAHLSDWVPHGLDLRLHRFGQAVQDYLPKPSDAKVAEVESAAISALNHRFMDAQPMRAERVRMALRLVRWLQRHTASINGVAALSASYADDGAFADWARFKLLGGDDLPELTEAFNQLRFAVLERRDAENRTFAVALANQLREATLLGGRMLPVESTLEKMVAPLAASHPVLLLVMDGLSMSIFRELFERPERLGWSEWIPESTDRPLVGIAALPTVTEVSRASLLSGRIAVGASASEKAAFSTQSDLLAVSNSAHPPRLFHKGDLSTDGGLAQEVRSAISNSSQKVVAVVYNAVDDHLSGPDQLHQRWSLDDLRLLVPLLSEARASRRLILVTADHGHMLEDGSAQVKGGTSDRWRAGLTSEHSSEITLAGSRVLTPEGANSVVCLWSERARYTGRKNGYHGGASLAEVLVPMSVFAPNGVNVPGWKPAPPQLPDWWDTPNIKSEAPKAPVTPAKTRPRTAPPAVVGQGGLFGEEELPVAVATADASPVDWITALFASSVYVSQRQLAARVALPDAQMRTLLSSLEERGGKFSRVALAQRLGLPELRMGGLLSAARRMLNVDQSPVLVVDEASGTVELNRSLLLQQFHLSLKGN